MSSLQSRWRELSARQRTGILAAAVVQVGLQAAMLVDLRRRPAHRVRGNKRAWVAASFVNFAGPIAYFLRARR
ncbi:MAG: PLDc N-terminal domain-containing protein [Microbacteriaceae bacterium]